MDGVYSRRERGGNREIPAPPPPTPNRIIEFQLSSHWQITLLIYDSLPLFNFNMYLSISQAVSLHGTTYFPTSGCIYLWKGVNEITMEEILFFWGGEGITQWKHIFINLSFKLWNSVNRLSVFVEANCQLLLRIALLLYYWMPLLEAQSASRRTFVLLVNTVMGERRSRVIVV